MKSRLKLTVIALCLSGGVLEASFAFALSKTQFYQSGLLNASQGRYDSAIADYSQAIAQDTQFKDAYLQRGIAYFKEGLNDKAIFDFNKVTAADPENFEAYKAQNP